MSEADSTPVDPKVVAERARRLKWYYRNRERANAANKVWREANRERRNAARRVWAKKNRKKLNAFRARWKKDNPEKVKAKAKEYRERRREHLKAVSRRNHLWRTHGITVAEFDALLREQGGCCAICRTADPAPCETFAVDHDHATGAIRGLLCFHCNAGIGHLRDRPDLLRAALAYLRKRSRPPRRTADPPDPGPGCVPGRR